MGLGMVCTCVRHLLSYGLVELIDIFLYTNEYVLTERFPLLVSNDTFQRVSQLRLVFVYYHWILQTDRS